MSAVTWALLAAALLLVPLGDPVRARVHALAARRSGGGRVTGALPAGRRFALRAVPPAAPVAASAVVATLAVTALGGVVLGAAAGATAATASHLALAAQRRRAGARRATELLATVRLLAAELDAGTRPAEALAAAAQANRTHRDALLAAADLAARGEEADGVLAGTPDLVPLAHAWRLAAATGAPLSGVVGRVAGDLAARTDQARAVDAALAGARSSAGLLAVLPLLGIGLGAAMQADPLAVLLRTPAGHGLCLAGVVLDAGGLLWTQRLTARAERP